MSEAQDIIVKQDATEIQTKVEEVSAESIKYRRYSNLQGPLYTINSSDVFMIKYENGERLLMSDYLTEVSSSRPDDIVSHDIKTIEATIQKNLKKRNTPTAFGDYTKFGSGI